MTLNFILMQRELTAGN